MNKVVVVTRTKDREQFLRRAIKSVSSQTFRDYIHVIVNDGGESAKVDDIVTSLDEPTRSQIQVYHRDKPSNAPDTIFSESIDRVDSVYFAIHDDDDSWHSEFLQTTVSHLESNSQLGAVVVKTDKIIEEIQDNSIVQKDKSPWMPDMQVVNLYAQCSFENQLTPISTLYSRGAYQKVGKFDDSLPVVGDWEFALRLLMAYDVDFIDPGHALANYHHRRQADNSFASHNHRYYMNKVMNSYLRDELSRGVLGPGYIISKNIYNQKRLSTMVKKMLPGAIVNRLKRRVSS